MEASSNRECPVPTVASTTVNFSNENNEIRFVPNTREHYWGVLWMTLSEFPFPENVFAFLMLAASQWCMFGVVAVDSENKVAGYFLGSGSSTYGLSRTKTGNLTIVCVGSKHQKKGISKNMGTYMMEGKHPKFNPEDYDEILIQDTDTWNSPSWLFSDRTGFRYCPTHDMIRTFGFFGYLHILLEGTHMVPCQFMKRYVHTEEEAKKADEYERQKGIIACLVSGILPSVYWIVCWVIRCDNGVNGSFVGMVFGVTYFLLLVRFALAHSVAALDESIPPVVFREYNTWLSPFAPFLPIAIFSGVPLLGWTGGFYLGKPGLNYLTRENQRAIGKVYLPVNLFSLALFIAHCVLRLVAPSALLWAGGLLDVLGKGAFFCSITDLAFASSAFPSGAIATRRWNIYVFGLLWLAWCATLVISIACSWMTSSELHHFLDLSHAACRAV